MGSSQDTEITLGVGRMLMIFFGLVGVCAVCFGLGYNMGHSAGKPSSTTAEEAKSRTEAKTAKPKIPATEDLTFYNTVKQNKDDPQLVSPAEMADTAPQAPAKPARSPSKTTDRTPAAAYVVQVAAVTKKEDADALLGALRKKNYNVSEAMNLPHDKLYHVQVGPFSDLKEAETARARLVSDGYNPILKK
jgi:cell division septation protein DedD